jgi:hypothetical protein
MRLNRWWEDRPAERFWLETTDRPDIGIDLKAPQRDEGGHEHHSYALINEVRHGDVVFHYEMGHKPSRPGPSQPATFGTKRLSGALTLARLVIGRGANPVGVGVCRGRSIWLRGCRNKSFV